jgi:hypothetical protein
MGKRQILVWGSAFVVFAVIAAGCSFSPQNPGRAGRGWPSGASDPVNHTVLQEVSADPTYGFTEANPVKVGGALEQEGSRNQQLFLNALLGPNGEPITYQRRGSCCPFPTPHGFAGRGLLDVYEITYPGSADPVVLFLNMYDYDPPKAPRGFSHY